MTRVLKYLPVTAGVLMLGAPVLAQTTNPPSSTAPNMQDQRRTPGPAPARPRADRPHESLGQAPKSGVIQPPSTGDNGVIVPKNQSRTPTLKPPGTPGGNPNVEPK